MSAAFKSFEHYYLWRASRMTLWAKLRLATLAIAFSKGTRFLAPSCPQTISPLSFEATYSSASQR